jgi:hypothetical protein
MFGHRVVSFVVNHQDKGVRWARLCSASAWKRVYHKTRVHGRLHKWYQVWHDLENVVPVKVPLFGWRNGETAVSRGFALVVGRKIYDESSPSSSRKWHVMGNLWNIIRAICFHAFRTWTPTRCITRSCCACICLMFNIQTLSFYEQYRFWKNISSMDGRRKNRNWEQLDLVIHECVVLRWLYYNSSITATQKKILINNGTKNVTMSDKLVNTTPY